MEGIYVYNINNFTLYNKFMIKVRRKNNVFTEGHIIEKDKKTILIGPSFSSGYLFLWDFFNKNLINLIKLPGGITDICPWNNNYIFATLNGVIKNKFVLIDLDKKDIEKEFDDIKDNTLFGIKLLKREGDVLITFSSEGKLYLYKIW